MVVVLESKLSDQLWLSFSLALAKPNNTKTKKLKRLNLRDLGNIHELNLKENSHSSTYGTHGHYAFQIMVAEVYILLRKYNSG